MKTFPITRIDTTPQGAVILYGPRGSLIVRRLPNGTQVQFSRFETADDIARPTAESLQHSVDVSEIPIKSDGPYLPSIMV